jgi:hypothetical protein
MTLVLAILIIAGTDLSWWWLALAIPAYIGQGVFAGLQMQAVMRAFFKSRDRPSP